MSKMSWEESVVQLQEKPRFSQLMKDAYLGADLQDNVQRFRKSIEWKTTLAIVKEEFGDKQIKVLDIGAGNGIASIAFGMEGYDVVALEPDTSKIVGSEAIRKLVNLNRLTNVKVMEGFGETLPFDGESFEVVYCRQVLHHAIDLPGFLRETYRVTKKNGLLLTLRDHVVKNDKDKTAFLKRHPIHKMYGGENAFTLPEYTGAITSAGFSICSSFSASQSPLNYSPWTKENFYKAMKKRIIFLPGFSFIKNVLWSWNLNRLDRLPGTLYSFICTKKA